MINLNNGQEMKISISSVDDNINSKSKTIRFLNPQSNKTLDVNVTSLARDLFANSQNAYKSTSGFIDLGIFKER